MASDPSAPPVIDPVTRAQLGQWLATWQRMGPILEAERTAELQALTEVEAARIAVELVWPMGTLGDHRGGDDAEGLVAIKDALRALAV